MLVILNENIVLMRYDYRKINQSKFMIYNLQKCGETGRQYTFAQMRDHSAALAVRLQTQLGLKKGDVVAICLPNIPEFPIAALAAFEAGLVATSVNPIYTSGKHIY